MASPTSSSSPASPSSSLASSEPRQRPATAFTLRERARRAVADPRLQAALAGATDRFHGGRAAVMADFPDPEAMRDQTAAIRQNNLDRHDELIRRFVANFEASGGKVHHAADAAAARKIVLDLVQTHGVRLIVKGKSMVSEEIGLNLALEAAGIRVVETDLGEFIVQLAGEGPSHIVAPAVHKTRQEVSRLFEKHLGSKSTEDIAELTVIARRALRRQYLAADMGISGGNFLVADPGAVVTVTNEGNGRFVTSLPQLVVAITGIEKVVADFAELAVLLKMLPRNATGQRITSYVNINLGHAAPEDLDGPREYHVVLVDNGRSRAMAGAYAQAMRCLRCGACLNACPVYRRIGGHAYGWVYPGPIGVVLTSLYRGLAAARDVATACTLCGACGEVCPTRIDLPGLILRLRADLAEGGFASPVETAIFSAWGRIMASPGLYDLVRRTAAVAARPFADTRMTRLRPLPYPLLGRWTRERDFPVPSRAKFAAAKPTATRPTASKPARRRTDGRAKGGGQGR